MKQYIVLAILVLSFATSRAQQAISLDSIISEYQQHRDFDRNEFPLGRNDEQLPKERADFATGLLSKLDKITVSDLSKGETISFKLLRFVLQDQIDEYSYKMYLNPLQADQGFHLDLNYQVRPIRSYKQAKEYLDRLKAIPYFTDSQFKLMRKGLEQASNNF